MMPLKELRRLWGVRKQSATCSGGEEGGMTSGGEEGGGDKEVAGGGGGTCALPLLQVWPSQDSPRGEADGQSFIFVSEETAAGNALVHNASRADSGIDSVQASPCCTVEKEPSPTTGGRRPSTSLLLHPNHARLLRRPSSPENHSSIDEEFPPCNGSKSSSTASSMTSVAAGGSHRLSDPWERERDRRRSSTITARYSLLDALDLEYALLRAAARGSVGPYSLSESLHKLTFTQSLAFPALARGLASKRRPSQTQAAPLDPNDSGLNAFARIVTALVLMLVSVMVFGVVYKFVRT
ncbi:hypothetical protein LSTR_LSTR009757 [Laodelphax striatellus]|uniref:Uncharacterized protein n=1 Tax=Laodelphax striatellus TaxID=195883 RepID=A0A482WIX8_LAOST|nr:hypothetical protein LSTR_LSTR009757 [Laodelphax striatellus]